MGTPDSPVAHRTWHCSLSGACHVSRPLGFRAVDRWSPLSSCGTGQSGVFWLLTAMSTVHCSPQSTVGRSWPLLRWLTRHVRCTPDSPVNYSIATLWKTRERPVHGVPWLGHRTVSGAPLATPMLVFAPNFVEFFNLFSLLVYAKLYAPEINDN
jgi:non-ribosomal peptide synthetase component F